MTIPEPLITGIAFFIVLAILVLIHELGHFLAAKKLGVKVEEFGFGFPPRVWGKKIGETLYSFNLLPLGGFVKVFGEEYFEEDRLKEMSDEAKQQTLAQDKDATDIKVQVGYTEQEKKQAFVYQHPWKRVVILTAGVVMNFLLGWIIISYLFTQGVPTPVDKVILEQVVANSPASIAGLKKGDIITSIKPATESKIEVTKTETLIETAKKYEGQAIGISYLREGNSLNTTLTPRVNPPKNQGALGVVITNFEIRKYPWYEAPYYGLRHATRVTLTIVTELSKTLYKLVTFQAQNVDVTGPVGIAQYTGQALKFGPNAILELLALLSLNLAVVNLLPFPALDGGRLVFVMYEWITKKRLHHKVEQYMNLIGFVSLLGLSVVITVFDILKLVK